MPGRIINLKCFVQYTLLAGFLASAPVWATDIVGTVKKSSDSTTVIAGATVILTAGALRDTVVSDSSGHYTFLAVTAGNRSIAASAAGYVAATVNTTVVTANAFDTVNIYLATAIPGSITGRVFHLDDSTALSGAKVYLRRTSATAAIIDSAVSNDTGGYTFSNVAPGTPNYYLTVSAVGFVDGTRTNLAVPNGGVATANFYMALPGTITGIVRENSDSTTVIVGAKIVRRRGSATGTPIDSVLSNAQGAFTFTNVAPGTPNYWLTTTENGHLAATNANIVVANGGITNSNIYMTVLVPSSIEGKVVRATDSITPIVALLYLRRGSATGTIIDSTVSLSTGAYSFSDVTPGTPNYWISVSATGYLAGTRNNLTVPNSSSVTVNFFLTTAIPATISGVALDSNTQAPIAGVQVVLRRTSATSAIVDSAVTDSLGAYSFKNVSPGTPNYWITASALNYTAVTRNNVAVANGATVTANFTLLSTTIGDAIHSPGFAARQGLRFIAVGDLLAFEIPVSKLSRVVTIYNLNGSSRKTVAVPAGVSRVFVSRIFAPENGFLYQVK